MPFVNDVVVFEAVADVTSVVFEAVADVAAVVLAAVEVVDSSPSLISV